MHINCAKKRKLKENVSRTMLCNQRIHLNVKIGTKLYCSSLCYAKNVYKEKKTDPTESLWKKNLTREAYNRKPNKPSELAPLQQTAKKMRTMMKVWR